MNKLKFKKKWKYKNNIWIPRHQIFLNTRKQKICSHFLKSHNCYFGRCSLWKLAKGKKIYIYILSKHDLYQLYCHLFNKYLPSTHYKPRAGNRAENKTEKVPGFWSQISSRKARLTKIKELIIITGMTAAPERYIKGMPRKSCKNLGLMVLQAFLKIICLSKMLRIVEFTAC